MVQLLTPLCLHFGMSQHGPLTMSMMGFGKNGQLMMRGLGMLPFRVPSCSFR